MTGTTMNYDSVVQEPLQLAEAPNFSMEDLLTFQCTGHVERGLVLDYLNEAILNGVKATPAIVTGTVGCSDRKSVV